jgi:hypothetical protein
MSKCRSSLVVVSNSDWMGPCICHGDVVCLDSSTWHHGIGHELGVGPPPLVKSKPCVKCG